MKAHLTQTLHDFVIIFQCQHVERDTGRCNPSHCLRRSIFAEACEGALEIITSIYST